jgi:hypothetical protein
MPEHLGNALDALESHPECVATFSNFLDSWGPTTVPWHTVKAWRVWAAANCDFSPSLLVLDKASVLLACLIESSFHYSTVVARKDAYWGAYLKMLEANNAWDNERIFPVLISAFGKVGYVTRHNAVIRTHANQEGMEAAHLVKGLEETRTNTTRWLAQLEPETTALAVSRFNDSVRTTRVDAVGSVLQAVTREQMDVLVHEVGLKFPWALPPRLNKKKDRNAKWLIKQLLPPMVLALQRKVKSKVLHTSEEG